MGCSDDDNVLPAPTPDPNPDPQEQIATCTIEAPADGAEIDMSGIMQIKGDATVNEGKIVRVEVKVNDKLIKEITEVPFDYGYKFTEDQPEGKMKIELSVEGDRGGKDRKSVTVNLKRPYVPDPKISCTLTAPTEGSVFDMTTPMTISGTAEASDCKIVSVELKVGDRIIPEVTQTPFDYEYTFGEADTEGALKITLTVTGDVEGIVATDELNVMLQRPADTNQFTDARDGHVYKTVVIGNQTWMAENLAYLPQVNNINESSDIDRGKKFYYVLYYNGNDVEAAKATAEYSQHGVLYNWYAAVDAEDFEGTDPNLNPSGLQGACPEGWHLPSKAEWQELEAYVKERIPEVPYKDGEDIEQMGKNVCAALASKDGWIEPDPFFWERYPDFLNGMNDVFGFGAKPAGRYTYTSDGTVETLFIFNRTHAYYWLPTQDNYGGASVYLTNTEYNMKFAKGGFRNSYGQSIRCVKD